MGGHDDDRFGGVRRMKIGSDGSVGTDRRRKKMGAKKKEVKESLTSLKSSHRFRGDSKRRTTSSSWKLS
jgi:hypothetical protein